MDTTPDFNPTPKDIDRIVTLCTPESRLHGIGTTTSFFYQISEDCVVKISKGIGPYDNYEARVMELVREHCRKIPIPTVYMAFQSDDCTYIVMELFGGKPLSECEPVELPGLLDQLEGIIGQLQTFGNSGIFPSPSSFGSFPSGPYVNAFFGSFENEEFVSVREFHNYFLIRLKQRMERSDQDCLRFDKTFQALLRVRDMPHMHFPLLTHGDLSPQNIFVDGGRIVSVLGWATLGWYPPFWEHIALHRFFQASQNQETASPGSEVTVWTDSTLEASYVYGLVLQAILEEDLAVDDRSRTKVEVGSTSYLELYNEVDQMVLPVD